MDDRIINGDFTECQIEFLSSLSLFRIRSIVGVAAAVGHHWDKWDKLRGHTNFVGLAQY
jgi:hypothetical protein